MKHLKAFLAALLCVFSSVVSFAFDGTPIPVDEFPDEAKKFVNHHFKEERKIVSAQMDVNSYWCQLDDETELEFNSSGEFQKVDCKTKHVPYTMVPPAIISYIRAHYPGSRVTKLEVSYEGKRVGLSNDMWLKFTRAGAFIAIDE